MTKQEAIKEFKKQYNWMADETEKRERIVEKKEYFKENGLKEVCNHCYCCEYVDQFSSGEPCKNCPIDWGVISGEAQCVDGLYGVFYYLRHGDWQTASKIAREIANLPENPNAKDWFQDEQE